MATQGYQETHTQDYWGTKRVMGALPGSEAVAGMGKHNRKENPQILLHAAFQCSLKQSHDFVLDPSRL